MSSEIKNDVLFISILVNLLLSRPLRTEAEVRKHIHVIIDFQLEKLLQEVRKVSQGVRECKFQEHLLSKCALFVCNKWDQVPVDEIEAVKSHVTKKLKGLSSGLDPESQIIYMSTKNATIGQKYGIVTKDFSLLMDGMRTVVLKSIEARLEIHWR